MSALAGHPLFLTLGWTLLHSLWQVALLGLLARLGLRLLRGRSAGARYVLACAALALMLAVPAATWRVLSSGLEAVAPGPLEALPRLGGYQELLRPALPWASALWLAGVGFMSLRLLGGWVWMQRLRWRLAEPAAPAWQRRVARLSALMGLRGPVTMLKSLAVDAPMVIGWLRPVILVPAAALTGLAPEALEAVLIHELEHIRRHDYLVNLLQSVAEALLFYHPAAWWLSRQIRLERENCCDDAAVTLCGDPVLYARALAGLEDLRQTHEPNPTLALAADGGNLMQRIQRLLLPKLPPSSAGRAGLLAVLAVSALGAATSLGLGEDPKPKAGNPAPQATPAPEPKPERRKIKIIHKGPEGALDAMAKDIEAKAELLAKKEEAALRTGKADLDLPRLQKEVTALAREISAQARKVAAQVMRNIRIEDGDVEILGDGETPGPHVRVEKRITRDHGVETEETTTPDGKKRIIVRHGPGLGSLGELDELRAELHRLQGRLDRLDPEGRHAHPRPPAPPAPPAPPEPPAPPVPPAPPAPPSH